jgi:CheY-like chemotaxis protein
MQSYKRLLLVDDDADDQEIFLEALHFVGDPVDCITAADGQAALDLLQTDIDLPDLIFLDINMPRMDGVQLLSELKQPGTVERLKHIPVIIYSTTIERTVAEKTRKLGAMGVVTKPVRFSELCLLLKSVLSGSHMATPLA